MPTTCQIVNYKSYSDRGAFMFKELWDTVDVDPSLLKVGERLPYWDPRIAPKITYYDGQRLDLLYDDQTFSVQLGEEVLISEGSGPEDYGVICTILHCVRLTDEDNYIDDDGRYDAYD